MSNPLRKLFSGAAGLRRGLLLYGPFLGAGASFVDLSITENDRYYYGSRELESDSDFGLWYGAGVYYEPQPGFTLGLTVQQVVDAEVSLAGQELDAGSFDVLLLLGFSW